MLLRTKPKFLLSIIKREISHQNTGADLKMQFTDNTNGQQTRESIPGSLEFSHVKSKIAARYYFTPISMAKNFKSVDTMHC